MALAKRIIPCLDVDNGRVVKGINFIALRDAGNPVEVAQRYNDEGADELTFLDITASSENRDTILHTIEAVASKVFIPLTVGGGIIPQRYISLNWLKRSVLFLVVRCWLWPLMPKQLMLIIPSGKYLLMVADRKRVWMLLFGRKIWS